MPTYEYRCEKGHTFERFQKMSDPPVDVCPECGAPAERLMSAGAGLVFKGSGFYITDYRGEDYRKAAESDRSGAAGSAGTAPTTGGTDAAPAAPAPSTPAAPAASPAPSDGGSKGKGSTGSSGSAGAAGGS
jgi:putative FmdB family regulatory protein